MTKRKVLKPGIAAGINSGCPFCLARTTGLPKVKDRIQILTDYRAGLKGTVVETPPSISLRKGEFLVQFDHDRPEIQQKVSLERDLILIGFTSEEPIPIWAPPITLREATELDNAVIQFCQRGFSGNRWKPHLLSFYEIIKRVWSKRLPVEAKEVWAILEAHGVPQLYKKRLTELFHDGRNLLEYAIGRKPIKKKGVPPVLS